ncbi:hypothetical protein GCM10028807_29760 [Spirosoma daeguense]
MSVGVMFMLQSLTNQQKPLSAILSEKKDQRRVLLLYASDKNQPDLVAQQTIFSKVKADLDERELDVVQVENTTLSESDRQFLIRNYKLKPSATFIGWLIGKDGGVKQTYQKPVSSAELFRLIDSMPMRKLEMRN